MPKGGARNRSGPASDPMSLRSMGDKSEWVTLPSVGRSGVVPEWPLSEATGRESVLWVEQWARPQALLWEVNGQELEVALFVRSVVDAESPKATTAARTLVRQQMDSLLLTIPAMRAAKVRIGEEPRKSGDRPVRSSSARGRLKVVAGEYGSAVPDAAGGA